MLYHSQRSFSTNNFLQGNYSPLKKEEMKFSAFMRNEKDYSVEPRTKSEFQGDNFMPKEEVMRVKFDPNVRETPMEIPNHLIYRYMEGVLPQKEPESAYVAIHHNGQTWHLFNAAKMPLGRMAAMIAVFVRGKHKPTYTQNRFDLGDKCVVVNASNVKVTGQKKTQKLYRHHTGYPGGLKEILMKDLIQKDPAEVIRRAVKGMIAKNNIREGLLDSNLIVHAGLYHTHTAQKLPQFVQRKPRDINQYLGLTDINKETATVIYESDPKNSPVEMKDLPRDIDTSLDFPLPLRKKTHQFSKKDIRKGQYLKRTYKDLKKFREY